MVADPIRVVPDLPEGWLPDPALILAFAKPPAENCDVWEVLLPSYTIAAQGETFHEAMDEATELLEDYWRMCADEGLSYDQTHRPIGNLWFASLLTRALLGFLAGGLRERLARRRPRMFRYPVDSGTPRLAV